MKARLVRWTRPELEARLERALADTGYTKDQLRRRVDANVACEHELDAWGQVVWARWLLGQETE